MTDIEYHRNVLAVIDGLLKTGAVSGQNVMAVASVQQEALKRAEAAEKKKKGKKND